MGCHYLSRNQKLEYRSNPRILIPTTWELLPIASTSNSTHPPADTEDGYVKPRLTDRKKTAKKIMILKSQLHRERLVCSRIGKHLRDEGTFWVRNPSKRYSALYNN